MENSNFEIAIVEIGNSNKQENMIQKRASELLTDLFQKQQVVIHNYFFEENITEFELEQEIKELYKHYNYVILPQSVPQHIRKSTIESLAMKIKEEKQNA